MKILTDEERQKLTDELLRIKQYFPYRIIFGVVYPDGNIETYATLNKRKMNKFLKMVDYQVFQLQQ